MHVYSTLDRKSRRLFPAFILAMRFDVRPQQMPTRNISKAEHIRFVVNLAV